MKVGRDGQWGEIKYTYPKINDDLRLRVGGKNLIPKAIEAVSEDASRSEKALDRGQTLRSNQPRT